MTASPKMWLLLVGASVTLVAWGLRDILAGLYDPIIRGLGG